MSMDKHTTAGIYEILRDRICLLGYPPGTVLRETVLAKEFGISRTPIRAVLQRLEHGSLVTIRDGVGTIVTDIDAEELCEIYEMRLKMAELIGTLTPRKITTEDVVTADNLLARAQVLVKTYNATEYWQINHAQHALIVDLIGNSVLRDIWDQLYFRSARFWYREASRAPAGMAQDLVAELNGFSRALHEQDAIAVGYTQRNFIAYGFARLKAALDPDQPTS